MKQSQPRVRLALFRLEKGELIGALNRGCRDNFPFQPEGELAYDLVGS
jgi:hypothetical protein